MKKNTWTILLAMTSILAMLQSCEVVGGIFKAGMWTGTIIVVLIIAVVIWIVSKLFSRNK